MRPLALELVPPADVELLERIRAVVQAMPDVDLGSKEDGEKILLSCHMVARALAEYFPVSCVDGEFVCGFMHSWLLTPEGNVIDPYPILVLGGPYLMAGHLCVMKTPAQLVYKAFGPRDGLFRQEWFKRSLARVAQAVGETIQRLDIKTDYPPKPDQD